LRGSADARDGSAAALRPASRVLPKARRVSVLGMFGAFLSSCRAILKTGATGVKEVLYR
jgi:hypothetical protein